MTRFFRSGIYEYDKRKVRTLKICERCGTSIHASRGAKRFCLPCYDIRLHEGIAARRHRYRKTKTTTAPSRAGAT